MKARVKSNGSDLFVGTLDGFEIVSGSNTGGGTLMDVSSRVPGTPRKGPSPMEMVLIGTGGCSAVDIIEILKSMKEPVEGVIIDLDAERADSMPKVFVKLQMNYTVLGDVDLAKAEQAVKMSADEYCSASIMIGKTAKITRTVQIQVS
jgi:putative redox protein